MKRNGNALLLTADREAIAVDELRRVPDTARVESHGLFTVAR